MEVTSGMRVRFPGYEMADPDYRITPDGGDTDNNDGVYDNVF